MSHRYTISVEPSVEPVSLSEAKTHLRVTIDDDDTYITALIKAARQYVENYLSRALITQTWKLYLDYFPDEIVIPRPPFQSATITYVDTDGATQTATGTIYTVDTDSEPGLIYEAYDQNWPTTRTVNKAVTVTFIGGYGDASIDIPEAIIWAIKLIINHLYENRETTISGTSITTVPMTVEPLLAPYRIMTF